mmetsp:Transcript_102882/g.331561  ORF Transcript_102882/g.331561 Transcript_102882/m.331561 type:complete len:421 (-) Transcript_102882:242-1504(-)
MPAAMKRPAAASGAMMKKQKVEAPQKAPQKAAAKAPAKKQAVPVEAPKAPKRDPRLAEVDAGIALAAMPEEAQDMLNSMAEFALLTYKEDRDDRVAKVVDMFSDVLEGVKAGYEHNIEEGQRLVDESEATQETQQDKINSANVEVEAQKVELKSKKQSLAEIARNFRLAREAMTEIEGEELLVAREIAKVASRKEKLEATVAECFRPLVSEGGLSDEAEAKAKVEKLTAVLREEQFDESLVTSLPTALSKATDARGSFDMMVLTQFEQEVVVRVAAMKATLDGAEGAKAERTQRLESSRKTFEEAKNAQLESASIFTKAQEEEARREEALRLAKHQMSDLRKEARAFFKSVERATFDLKFFSDGPMAAFAALRELTAPPPPPAEPVVEEEESAAAPMEEEEPAEIATDMEPAAVEEPIAA